MRRFLKLHLALLLTLTVYASNAAANWHTSTIDKVYPVASGDVILVFSNDDPACQYPNSPHYYLLAVGQFGVTADGFKNMYAAALAAAAGGHTVTIFFDDGSASCPINRLHVNFGS